MRIQFLAFLLTFLSFHISFSQVGTGFLDTTFNTAGPIRGRVNVTFPGGSWTSRAVLTDNSGRIVVAACSSARYGVFRLLPEGVLDGSFGISTGLTSLVSPGGNFYTDITAIAQLSNGQYLMAGTIGTGTSKDAILIKLRSNGVPDSSWYSTGLRTFDLGSNGEDQINDMVLGNDGSIFLVGRSGINGICVKLRSDGTYDPTFGVNGVRTWSTSSVRDEASSIKIKEDTIYIAGHYEVAGPTANNSFTVLKLSPDGTQAGFGKVNLSSPANMLSTSLILQPDNKILVGGNVGTNFIAYRLLPSGNLDLTFGTNGISQVVVSGAGYPATMTDLVLDTKDKKIILTGTGTTGGYYNYIAARLNMNGALDNNFGNGGIVTINPTGFSFCYSFASILSNDGRLLMVGGDGTASVLKVFLRPVFHILGKDYVVPNSAEMYEIKVPGTWPYSYRWSYSGSNFFFVPDSIGSKVMLYFNEKVSNGILTCYAHIGTTVYATAEMEININNNSAQANLLTEVQCTREVSDCSNNYINYFKFNLISNDSSNCHSTGYSDFTRSKWVDTIIAGSVYSALIRAESNEPIKYAAIWIDYNNDGYFDPSTDFVQQVHGPGPMLKLTNIILKNQDGYSGPKRLRVRCSPYAFTPSQACPGAGELGETEDYLVIINEVDKLQAPGIITPNDDGKNDYFVIRGIDPKVDNKLTIMDRYGNVVFTTSKYENNWDGKDASGAKVNPGTYYYYFDNNGDNIRGFVEVRY